MRLTSGTRSVADCPFRKTATFVSPSGSAGKSAVQFAARLASCELRGARCGETCHGSTYTPNEP
eukprot:scaffold42798_cov66-Phaeocystis_antarctica.AAC.2